MQVRFTFNKAAVERRGYVLEDVHRTVKSLFAVYGLPCVSEGDPLSFQDKGHGDDFACMWEIILSLLRSDSWPVPPPASGRTRTAGRMCWPRPERREVLYSVGTNRKQITSHGDPAKTQRSGFCGERKKEWSGCSPRRQAETEQSGISSDESQEALEMHYPHSERSQSEYYYRKAYQDIRKFMNEQGFAWQQHSVYISEKPMTTMDIVLLSQRMAEEMPWLRLYVKEITAADIGARHSLLGLLRSDAPPAELLPPPAPRERQKKKNVLER